MPSERVTVRVHSPIVERWREVCKTFHDYVLFMGNTGLRPDESARLELRDAKLVHDESTGERSLEIKVRSKCGLRQLSLDRRGLSTRNIPLFARLPLRTKLVALSAIAARAWWNW